MIYTSTGFICLDISILLVFLIFCLSDFNNNRKSNVDTIPKTKLAVFHNKVSSPRSSDRKKALPVEFTPETTFIEVWKGNSRGLEVGDLS